MILYNKNDFLELFEQKQTIDVKNDIVQYNISCPDGFKHFVYIDPLKKFIGITINTITGPLINLSLHQISNIICKRNDETIAFYFFQDFNAIASTALMVKPTISIIAELIT